jgi:hypothetical protein
VVFLDGTLWWLGEATGDEPDKTHRSIDESIVEGGKGEYTWTGLRGIIFLILSLATS